MGEVGGAVARGHQVHLDARLLQGPALKDLHLGDVVGDLVGGQGVPGLVQEGRTQVLGGGVALSEAALAAQAGGELLGHGLTGVHVHRVAGQDLGVQGPGLVDLAGELHHVIGHVGPRGAGVVGVGQQGVQGVAELVEAGNDLVPGQEGRPAFLRYRHVGAVDDHWPGPPQVGLVDQAVHPGATGLALTGEVVADEQPQHRCLLPRAGRGTVTHLPDPHAGVVHVGGQVGPLVEGQAVETVGGVEDALLDDVPQLQVGGQGGVVHPELLPAQPRLVQGPVGRAEDLPGQGERVGGHARGQDGGVAAGVGHGRRGQASQHGAHGLRGAGRGPGGHQGGVVLKAQQGGPLGT